MVEMLLKHGADVNKSDWLNKFTPLQLANKERGCDFFCGKQNPPFTSLFMFKCQTGLETEALKIFLSQIERRDKVNYDRISELLIKSGADVNLKNAHGITVLHDAAQYGLFLYYRAKTKRLFN